MTSSFSLSAFGSTLVLASFSTQFSVVLTSLKLNERHWQFCKHLLKHSLQSQMKLKVSKTFPTRAKFFLVVSVARLKDIFSQMPFVQWLCTVYVWMTSTVRNNKDKTPRKSILRFLSRSIRLAKIIFYRQPGLPHWPGVQFVGLGRHVTKNPDLIGHTSSNDSEAFYNTLYISFIWEEILLPCLHAGVNYCNFQVYLNSYWMITMISI